MKVEKAKGISWQIFLYFAAYQSDVICAGILGKVSGYHTGTLQCCWRNRPLGWKRGNSDRAGAVLPALSFSASGRTVSSDMEYRGYCDRGQQRKSLWCFAAPTQYHESRNRFYIYGSYHKNSIWNRAICVVFPITMGMLFGSLFFWIWKLVKVK